jgi:Kef-type K+ transport system membrane component KefB
MEITGAVWRMRTDILFYFLLIIVAGVTFFWIVGSSGLHPVTKPAAAVRNGFSPAILILQVLSILVLTRCIGFFLSRLGQPLVISEIIAGIILGPSMLGLFFPGASHFLFPAGSMPFLQAIGQMGLILFMFVVGLELDLNIIRKRGWAAVIISHSSILLPFTLGMIAAYFLYDRFASAGTPFLSFALFIGIVLSITAFPVLARILQERGMTGSPVGSLAITCAATDDITAWCLLAVVVAITRTGTFGSALLTVTLAAAYVVFMLLVIRPLLRTILKHKRSSGNFTRDTTVLSCLLLLFSSYITDQIGIHALFGAFLAGVTMPAGNEFRKNMIQKVDDVSVILFLPLFFAFSGLRTRIDLLGDLTNWIICLGTIALATLGKFGGTTIAGMVVGLPVKDNLTLGALMNTRGLMELIALNIGYDLGVLTPTIFTIMVLMALVTTFLTCPVLDVINRWGQC